MTYFGKWTETERPLLFVYVVHVHLMTYRISSNRSPQLVLEQCCQTPQLLLETQLVFETRLLLELPGSPASNFILKCNFSVLF